MTRLLGFTVALVFGVAFTLAADVEELIQKLKSTDNDVRRAAAKALAEAGTEAKPAVSSLTQALKDNDRFVRRFAAQALGKIGPDAKAAVPDLAALLKNAKEQKEVQEAAATALGKIGKPSVAALSDAVKNAKLDVLARKAAANSLAQIGPDARDAIPALASILQHPPPPAKGKAAPVPADIRAEVITALGKIATANDKEAIDALQAVIDEKGQNNVRMLANSALRAIKERK